MLSEAATLMPAGIPKQSRLSAVGKARFDVELRENPAGCGIPRSLVVRKLVRSTNVTEICGFPTGTNRAQGEKGAPPKIFAY
jgi:hypothetical protein